MTIVNRHYHFSRSMQVYFMERKLILSILAVALVALAAAILLPGGRTVDKNPKLPWKITVDEAGSLTVFDLTLGRSTLKNAQDIFQEQGTANLFLSPEQEYSTEVYFQRLYLSGIRADIVLDLEISEEKASEIFDRGLRISRLGSGVKKIELSADDLTDLGQEPIKHIIYGPATDLDEALISRRFGEPYRRIAESGTEITHWLYPDKGLDIAVNADGKEIFQYVNPGDFEQIMAPLRKAMESRGAK